MIRELQVSNLRNIAREKIVFSCRFNLISGDNGAGKSTLLEALYLLGHGRTFRTRYANQLLKINEKCLQVTGRTFSGQVLEVKKSEGKTSTKINGKAVKDQLSQFETLPVFTFHPDSHQLLQGSSKLRLHFIDRNLFHVKHSYRYVWYQFYRALRQRNQVLRGNQSDRVLENWDKKVVELSNALTTARKKYVSRLTEHFTKLEIFSIFSKAVHIRYYQGWDDGFFYSEVLRKNRLQDRHLGYTLHGPHRADLKVLWGDRLLTKFASRGQHKMIVCMMMIAAASYFHSVKGRECVFLVDDMSSELDKQKQHCVLKELKKTFWQVFFTSVDKNILQTVNVEKHLFVMSKGKVLGSFATCP